MTHTFPLRVAAIDLGSNAIRFLAAEFTAPTQWRPLDSHRAGVRLGQAVFEEGAISPPAMDAALETLSDFHLRMKHLGVENYRAVATSAVRESANQKEFVERVLRDTGVRLEVIDAAEEARLGWMAIRSRLPMGRQPWLVADLGGGSLELSLMDAQGMRGSESLPLGAVRLLRELEATEGGDTERQRRHLERLLPALPSFIREQGRLGGLAALGGNIEVLARLAQAPETDAGAQVLSRSSIREQETRLAALSYDQRMERLGLDSNRADVIFPAALIYGRLADLAGEEDIHVPRTGVREGILLDLAQGREN